MTLQEFIESKKINGIIKLKPENKTMKKYLNQFLYIDTYEYLYDDVNNPTLNNWIDIEGIGDGWIWLNYEKSKKLQRKNIIKYAMELYRASKDEICIEYENDIVNIFLEDKYELSIIQIRVSNKELKP